MTTFSPDLDSLLQAAYRELDLENGDLVAAAERPLPSDPGRDNWVDNGEWLSLASTVGAEKLFFVNNNPVFVFARHDHDDPEELRRFFNRIWCMSRPRRLFLATPGRLSVYDLEKAPVKPGEPLDGEDRLLSVVESVEEVQSTLAQYHRSVVESGRVPGDERFEEASNRADAALIRDLRTVRQKLIDAGLDVKYTHALIGRSIFLRYLEDREVLEQDYFDTVAERDPAWQRLLDTPPERPDIEPAMERLLYPRVLADKEFTYALFDQLAKDFNGDMFPSDAEEKRHVTQTHLDLLQGFLRGVVGPQASLFFYAYKFDVIPIELISSIYEEFYNTTAGPGQNQGSHYTRSTLVEYLLSQVLSNERLASRPRVLDPACGSGIFLVEAFRRIVRYHTYEHGGEKPNRQQLSDILRDQIAGVEINPEAVRVAAFSLYLAFLHYQHPRNIRRYKTLPHLIHREGDKEAGPGQHFDILFPANAFGEVPTLIEGRVFEAPPRLRSGTFDVVVGNPPWGSPKEQDDIGKAASKLALVWCRTRGLAVGDNELSQAFIHRTIDLLRDGGHAGLLVSTGVFFKMGELSRRFRQQWLRDATLKQVVNIAHVRDVFFRGPDRGAEAISPFASVTFRKGREAGACVQYWTAKKSPFAYAYRAVALSLPDLHVVPQEDLLHDDELWKVFWWGGSKDRALVSALRLETTLAETRKDGKSLLVDAGAGFEEGRQGTKPSGDLAAYREFPTKAFERYGPLPEDAFRTPPEDVRRLGKPKLYDGPRLLIKRGIQQRNGANGRIVARYETSRFCFRHSIFGFLLRENAEREAQILLGIIWSSLARYYYFMTAGSWGMWHHEVLEDSWKQLPVRLRRAPEQEERIVRIVEQLRGGGVIGVGGLFDRDEERLRDLEVDLDDAVFDLFELSPSERDLIRDMCHVGLDLFYRGLDSIAVQTVATERLGTLWGTLADLPEAAPGRGGIEDYLRAFLTVWNRKTLPSTEFRWRVVPSNLGWPMLAVEFSLQVKGSVPHPPPVSGARMQDLLRSLGENSAVPFKAERIYLDGMARVALQDRLILIKRNELRLWTASMAREDAEALTLQVIQRQEALGDAKRWQT